MNWVEAKRIQEKHDAMVASLRELQTELETVKRNRDYAWTSANGYDADLQTERKKNYDLSLLQKDTVRERMETIDALAKVNREKTELEEAVRNLCIAHHATDEADDSHAHERAEAEFRALLASTKALLPTGGLQS